MARKLYRAGLADAPRTSVFLDVEGIV